MKRKGFTLVELLIVVAILGALAAIMTVNSGSSIAKAKATAIANNLRVCTAGAQLYYLQSGDSDTTGIDTIKVKAVLDATVPNFTEFAGATDKIKYTSGDDTAKTAPYSWYVKVSFTGADSKDVITALSKIKGFSGATVKKDLQYYLFNGTAEAITAGS